MQSTNLSSFFVLCSPANFRIFVLHSQRQVAWWMTAQFLLSWRIAHRMKHIEMCPLVAYLCVGIILSFRTCKTSLQQPIVVSSFVADMKNNQVTQDYASFTLSTLALSELENSCSVIRRAIWKGEESS